MEADGVTYVDARARKQLRRGPGALAWISLALLILSVGGLVYALIVGAYGGALVSMLAILVLLLPTSILMAVWIEVRVDERRLLHRSVGEESRNTAIH